MNKAVNQAANRPSLRWRFALLASGLAGGVLLGFALLSGWLIYAAKLDRLDAQVENALLRLARPHNQGLRPDLEAMLAQELGLSNREQVALQVVSPDGKELYRSPQWPDQLQPQLLWNQLPAWTAIDPARPPMGPPRRDRMLRQATQQTDTGRWRLSAVLTPVGPMAMAVRLEGLSQEMAAIRRIYLITIPGALLLIAGGAWGLSGRALRPVHHLSQSMRQVTAQGLNQRVAATATDAEFGELIEVFNAMLERLERSFHQASRFSGDAAHELKTPLAILQGELEQALQQVPVGSSLQQTLGQLLEEVRRLSTIVSKLLLLSLADAGQISLHHQPVDLSSLLHEQVEDMTWLAPDLTLTTRIAPNLTVAADRDLLTQVLHNLLSNAVKYNCPQGWLQVEASATPAQILITVANACDPAAAPLEDQIFDRFYRGDQVRSRQTDGLGLGLSLAREIARTHGGDLVLVVTPPGEARFRLSLPR